MRPKPRYASECIRDRGWLAPSIRAPRCSSEMDSTLRSRAPTAGGRPWSQGRVGARRSVAILRGSHDDRDRSRSRATWQHDTGARPSGAAGAHRRAAAVAGLDRPDVVHVSSRGSATGDEITLVHGEGHFERVARTARRRRATPSTPTRRSRRSRSTPPAWPPAALLALLDEVMAGRLRNGFALVRPPGHHAERDRAMGFCLFNNVAIGAAYLRARHGLERVLIVDWDVHHGNGTQHIFARDPGVLYVSTHRYPFYPGTGALDEVGERRRRRASRSTCRFPGGFGDAEYVEAFRTVIEPIALEYAPQFVLISAGFDPHRRDPLGGMEVTERGFAAMARSLIDGRRRRSPAAAASPCSRAATICRPCATRRRAVLDELCGDATPPIRRTGAPSHAGPHPRRGASAARVGQLEGCCDTQMDTEGHSWRARDRLRRSTCRTRDGRQIVACA